MPHPTRWLLAIALVATAQLNAQALKSADSVSNYRQLVRMEQLGSMDSPRLSPDGRWLAFSATPIGEDDAFNLWIVSVNGGTPIRITTGRHTDRHPAWFPDSRQLAFGTDRTGGVMSVSLDTNARPVGSLKRLTVDSVIPFQFDITPDGKALVFGFDSAKTASVIKLMPIAGGPARRIGAVAGAARYPRFDAAGTWLYFDHEPDQLGGITKHGREIGRMSMATGRVETVIPIGPKMAGVMVFPLANRIIEREGSIGHVLTLHGDSVATFEWAAEIMRGVQSFEFLRDGSLVAGTSREGMVTTVLPLDGGPLRTIGNSTPRTEVPRAWAGDRLFRSNFQSKPDNDGFFVSTRDGLSQSFVPVEIKIDSGLARGVDAFSPDGRYFAVIIAPAPGKGGSASSPLLIYDSQTRTSRFVANCATRNIWFTPTTPGQYATAMGDEVVYGVRKGTSIELHAERFTGGNRLLYTISGSRYPMIADSTKHQRLEISVAPGKVAIEFWSTGTTYSLDLVTGSSEPQRVISMDVDDYNDTMAFSPDGKTLIGSISVLGQPGGKTPRNRLFAVNTDAATPPRVRWLTLPDSSGRALDDVLWADNASVLVPLTADNPKSIWRIFTNGTTPAQLVSQRLNRPAWDPVLSPDKRELMFGLDVDAGSTLWRIDLKAATGQQGKRRGTN